MHKAIPDLDAPVRNQIAAAVMFGDTRNKQDKGQIPSYPPADTKIFCNDGDDVCKNKIDASLLGAHLKYHSSVPAALDFIISKVNAKIKTKAPAPKKAPPKKATPKKTAPKKSSTADDSDSDSSE
jgi:Cutinase